MFDTPDPPQYNAAEVSQDSFANNIGSALASGYMNNPESVSTPFGTTTSSISGYKTVSDSEGNSYQVPRFSISQSLNADEQRKYDLQNEFGIRSQEIANQQLNRANEIISSDFDAASIAPAMKGDGSFDAYYDDVSDAMYQRWLPDYERQAEQERTRLLNQGVTYGSEAYANAMNRMDQRRNDAVLALDIQARNAAQQALSADRGSRNAALSEAINLRQQPLNEIASFANRSPVNAPQFQGFSGTAIQPVNTEGIYAQDFAAQQKNYYDQLNQRNAMMSGLFGLGATGVRAASGGLF